MELFFHRTWLVLVSRAYFDKILTTSNLFLRVRRVNEELGKGELRIHGVIGWIRVLVEDILIVSHGVALSLGLEHE